MILLKRRIKREILEISIFKLNQSTNLTNPRQLADQLLDNIKGAIIFQHNEKIPKSRIVTLNKKFTFKSLKFHHIKLN
jgi:hypothetical protein